MAKDNDQEAGWQSSLLTRFSYCDRVRKSWGVKDHGAQGIAVDAGDQRRKAVSSSARGRAVMAPLAVVASAPQA
jgi:hypothetical protein